MFRYISGRLVIAEEMMRSGEDFGQDGLMHGEETEDRESLAPVIMFTTAWCVECWRAKQVMDSMQVEYIEIDISTDEEAADMVMRLNRGYHRVPTLLFPDGSVMTEPRTSALMAKLQSLL